MLRIAYIKNDPNAIEKQRKPSKKEMLHEEASLTMANAVALDKMKAAMMFGDLRGEISQLEARLTKKY